MKYLSKLCAALLFLTSCSTISSLDTSLATGTSFVVTGHTYDQVYDAAYAVMEEKFTVESADRNTGVIKASHHMTIWSYGEVIGVSVSPPHNGAVSYTVKVKSMKRSKIQVTGPNFEHEVEWKIKNKLGIYK